MAAHSPAVQQAGPRQMLQLEDYVLPRWANALSAHVRPWYWAAANSDDLDGR